jgi:hypothetical protein
MEQKLNIAEILKNKPRGTKLYSMIHGKCSSEAVTDEIFKINFCTSKFGLTQSGECTLIKFGNMYDGGECIIFPSKEMRDWSKFFKKGDVLICYEGKKPYYTIFDGFEDNTYRAFKGKFAHDCYEDKWYQNEGNLSTNTFQKLNRADSEIYVTKIEERFGGKLNRETLEIEKPQPEFKDGDIITFKDRIIIIYNNSIEKYPNRTEIYYHACLKEGELTVNEYLVSCGFGEGWYSSTEEEKQQLFDALTKKGKAWDAEKKQIVDIKKELQFKPFEKVLVRDSYDDMWRASFFSHIKEDDGRYVTTGLSWKFCIPYEGNEHLLGTTDNFE